jgi:hypothetical protein
MSNCISYVQNNTECVNDSWHYEDDVDKGEADRGRNYGVEENVRWSGVVEEKPDEPKGLKGQ